MLPPKHRINYDAMCALAPPTGMQGLISLLREQLPLKWQEVYAATTTHVINIVRYEFRTFTYLFDLYSGLEAKGEVPYDQTIQDRVIGVLGTSAPAKRS